MLFPYPLLLSALELLEQRVGVFGLEALQTHSLHKKHKLHLVALTELKEAKTQRVTTQVPYPTMALDSLLIAEHLLETFQFLEEGHNG